MTLFVWSRFIPRAVFIQTKKSKRRCDGFEIAAAAMVGQPRHLQQNAMTNAIHFSSATDLWSTPPDFFAALDRIFHFTLDACATAENAKCAQFYTREQDGLAQPWTGTVWCNPPYGRNIGKWMRKAWEASKAGVTVVCLVPARPGSKWWHDFATKGDILFLRGRLKFGDAKSSAPFDSAVVTYCPGKRYMKQCVLCDNPFAAERSHAETCSGACRVRLHRQRARSIVERAA